MLPERDINSPVAESPYEKVVKPKFGADEDAPVNAAQVEDVRSDLSRGFRKKPPALPPNPIKFGPVEVVELLLS
jgi:hypothetical protein